MFKIQNKAMIKKSLFIATSLLLAACSGGEPFDQKISSGSLLPPDKARLVVFRDKNDEGGSIPVEVDGHSFSTLSSPSYYAHDIQPGVHNVSASALMSSGSARVAIEMQAGSVHYVQVSHRKSADSDAALIGAVSAIATTEEEQQRGSYRLIEVEPTAAVLELQGVEAED